MILKKLSFRAKTTAFTPAYDLLSFTVGQAVIRYGETIPTPPETGPTIIGTSTLFPSTESLYHIRGTPLQQAQFDRIRQDQNARFVYFGVVHYTDIFKERHYTRFCYMFGRTNITEKEGADGCLGSNDSN
jgi:hypothetical protein